MKLTRGLGLDRFSGLYLLLAFIVLFTVWQPHLFPTVSTADTVLSGQAVSAMIAMAVLVPLIADEYDLSVGATANLSAVVALDLQTVYHWAVIPAIFVALVSGVLVGVVNGFIVVRLRVSSFIATLGVGSLIAAAQTVISGNNEPLPETSNAWLNFTQTTIGGFQIAIIYVIALAIFLWWLLEHTPVGRYLHAVGGNSEAARLSGVNVDRWVWTSLIISASISGAAGIIYGSLIGPSLTFGPGLLLPAFAAVFLGSTQLKPGRFNVWGTVLAIYVLATGVQGFEYVTSAQWLSSLFNGVALIGAVSFAVWRQRKMSVYKHGITRQTEQPSTPNTSISDSNLPETRQTQV